MTDYDEGGIRFRENFYPPNHVAEPKPSSDPTRIPPWIKWLGLVIVAGLFVWILLGVIR